jgi:hypothetical protein
MQSFLLGRARRAPAGRLSVRARVGAATAAAAVSAAVAAPAPAVAAPVGTHSYYVGIDDFPTLTSGTYAGQPNPNFNRLTFLWADFVEPTSSNHYHSKAIFTYTGPAAAPTVINSPSNYVPEGANPPLKLSPGTGAYAGKLVSAPYTDPAAPSFHFSDLTLGSTRSLNGFGPTDGRTYMFNSSGGRWNSAFDAGRRPLGAGQPDAGPERRRRGRPDIGLNARATTRTSAGATRTSSSPRSSGPTRRPSRACTRRRSG